MTALNKLSNEYLQLIDMNQDDQAVIDTLEGITGEISQKGESINYVLRELSITGDGIDDEISRLKRLKSINSNRKKSLKEWLKSNMERCNINKITWATGSITLSKASKNDLSINDESLIDDDYRIAKTTVELDKLKIISDLKAGVEISGCELVQSKRKLLIK